jgi:hypothetical protein
MINPKMISKRRNMQLLLPVFFWYLNNGGTESEARDVGREDYVEGGLLCGDVQLFHRLGHLNGRLFDVVFYAVQQCALVDDHGGKVLEQHGQVGDGFSYLCQFAIALPQIRREVILRLQLGLKRGFVSKMSPGSV